VSKLRPRIVFVVPIASVLLLSACSSSFESPAAVVGGVKITQDELADQLALVLTNPQLSAQVNGPGGGQVRRDITRRLVAALVRRDVIDAYAKAHHLVVSPGEVARSVGGIIRQVGGLAAFRRILRQRGISEDEVRQNIYDSLVEQKVHDAVVFDRLGGAQVSAQQANQAFNTWLSQQLRTADVQVNPRFGRYDPKTGAICAVDTTADTASCPAA
jgi:major membrane immunogen (membrane-anchored lipoprotein)